MFEFIFKIWYMIAILPLYIFLEGSKMLSKFLKERNIYSRWDAWHSLLLVLVLLLIVLLLTGYY